MRDPIAQFSARLIAEWLPIYCFDPHRSYSPSGYKPESNKVTAIDAANCLRAIDSHLVLDAGGGRYRMPQSRANVVLFWEGARHKTPRPITLSMEPVITIASVARLHFDYDWPKNCLGMQSADCAFDLTAVLPGRDREYLVGEVKKSHGELQTLIRELQMLCAGDGADVGVSAVGTNSRKKWQSLMRSRAPLLWAVGPGGASHVFEVAYLSAATCAMHEVPQDRIRFPGISSESLSSTRT